MIASASSSASADTMVLHQFLPQSPLACTVTLIAICASVWYTLLRWRRRTLPSSLSRTILITGCDSGLGRASALEWYRRSLKKSSPDLIIAACLTEEARTQLEDEAEKIEQTLTGSSDSSNTFHTIRLDITNEEEIAAALQQVRTISRAGLHVLVNNAGLLTGSHLVEFTPSSVYQRIMDVNFHGTVNMCQAFLPLLKQTARRDSGKSGVRIVNLSSFGARIPLVSLSAYCASKAALSSFTDVLRQEISPFKVDVVTIEPGSMNTNMAQAMKAARENEWNQAPAAIRAEYGQAYADSLRRCEKLMDGFSRDVSKVVPVLTSAISDSRPSWRYTSGLDAWLFVHLAAYLPTVLSDFCAAFCLGNPKPAHGTAAQQQDDRNEVKRSNSNKKASRVSAPKRRTRSNSRSSLPPAINTLTDSTDGSSDSSVPAEELSPISPPLKPKQTNKWKADPNRRRFKLLRSFTMADFVTLGNAASGVGSIFFCLNFLEHDQYRPYIYASFGLLPLALIFDIGDGFVARYRQNSSPYGSDLDSLADVISFSVAPAVLGFTLGLRGAWDCGILAFFVCCGMSRLARYNVTAETLADTSTGMPKVKYYQGFPVPTSLFLVMVLFIMFMNDSCFQNLWFGSYRWSFPSFLPGTFHPFSMLFFLFGCAMVSEVKVPKP